jgi:hypothetical protein
MSGAQAGAVKAAPTGIHWHGPGWYSVREVQGVMMHYYICPKRVPLDEARAKATARGMGEPIQIVSKDGFDYAY